MTRLERIQPGVPEPISKSWTERKGHGLTLLRSKPSQGGRRGSEIPESRHRGRARWARSATGRIPATAVEKKIAACPNPNALPRSFLISPSIPACLGGWGSPTVQTWNTDRKLNPWGWEQVWHPKTGCGGVGDVCTAAAERLSISSPAQCPPDVLDHDTQHSWWGTWEG